MFLCAHFIGAIPQRIQYTEWCKPRCVHYHRIWPLKKDQRVRVKFHSYRVLAVAVAISSIPYSHRFYNFFHICHGQSAFVRITSEIVSWIFHWSKNFMNVMQLRATIANFRARKRVRHHGLVISVHTRLKYLRANQILPNEYHGKCVFTCKIKV